MTEPTVEVLAQIADQCRVVVHLAQSIAAVHTDYARMYSDPACAKGVGSIAGIVGPRTAALMEQLGEILNGMDAVDESDEWTAPIFEKAHAMFPAQVDAA